MLNQPPRFNNGDMGLPLNMVQPPCIFGCDVRPGFWDLIIADLPQSGVTRLRSIRPVFVGKLADEHEVLWVARQYRTAFGVVDTRPETSPAMRLQLEGKAAGITIHRAQYMTTLGGNVEITRNEKEQLLTLDRTLTMDHVLQCFKVGQSIVLPQNYAEVTGGDFAKEMKASTRIMIKHGGNSGCYVWENRGADHSHHAMNLLMVAFKVSGLMTFGGGPEPQMGIVEGTLGTSQKSIHEIMRQNDEVEEGMMVLEV